MKVFVFKYKLGFIGMAAGAVLGYLYYHFYGCNGSCSIKSSPVNMTVYGAIMGFLVFSLFQKENQPKKDN
jgi:uncharacterized membrane protein